MPNILIERTNELTNRLRNYGIYIDGNKVGTISNGETKEFEVSPGQHTIICKIDWCSSPEISFDVKDDVMKVFKVGGFKNAQWIAPIAGGIAGFTIFFSMSQRDNQYLMYALMPFTLVIIYFITIGRKKYLALSEA